MNSTASPVKMSYDRALTVFNPEGRLFQVEYAMESVNRGNIAIAAKTDDVVVIGIKKKEQAVLQDTRIIKKIVSIEDNIYVTYAGLIADARVLVDAAREHCAWYRLSYGLPITVEQCAKWIASEQQRYTHKGGVRPFGVSMIVCGITKGKARVFRTDPSGVCTEWKAVAVGKDGKNAQKSFEEMVDKWPKTEEELITLVRDTLNNLVQGGDENVEIRVIKAE